MSDTAELGAIHWVTLYKGTHDADEFQAAQALYQEIVEAKILDPEKLGALAAITSLVPREGAAKGITADDRYEGIEVGIRYEGALAVRQHNHNFSRILLKNTKRWLNERREFSKEEAPELWTAQDHPDTVPDLWGHVEAVFGSFVAGFRGRKGLPSEVRKDNEAEVKEATAYLCSMGLIECIRLAQEALGIQRVPQGDRFPTADSSDVQS